jgi:hypothetical protein
MRPYVSYVLANPKGDFARLSLWSPRPTSRYFTQPFRPVVPWWTCLALPWGGFVPVPRRHNSCVRRKYPLDQKQRCNAENYVRRDEDRGSSVGRGERVTVNE